MHQTLLDGNILLLGYTHLLLVDVRLKRFKSQATGGPRNRCGLDEFTQVQLEVSEMVIVEVNQEGSDGVIQLRVLGGEISKGAGFRKWTGSLQWRKLVVPSLMSSLVNT